MSLSSLLSVKGTVNFLQSLAVFFVSVQSVLHMRADDRQFIQQAIAQGLKPGGFVRPLQKVVLSNFSTVEALWTDEEAMTRKVVLRVKQSESPTVTFKTGSTCLIAGGTIQQTISLAHWSAKRGIKHIVAVNSDKKSALLRRHVDLLEALHGAKLHVCLELRNGLNESLQNGSLSLIFAVANDPLGERSATELAQFRSDVPFIVFGPKGSDHGTLADSCKSRSAKAPHSLLLVGRMEQAVSSRLMDWLLRNEKPPLITLMRCAADSKGKNIRAARLLKLLPQGYGSLAALGKSFTACPRLVDYATNGPAPSHAREVFPLYAVPGIAASVDTILKPLAEKLLVPLVCARLPETTVNVVDLAKEISQVNFNVPLTIPFPT